MRLPANQKSNCGQLCPERAVRPREAPHRDRCGWLVERARRRRGAPRSSGPVQLAASVTASPGGTPNRNACIAFPAPIANGRPITSPVAVRIIASRSTIASIMSGSAPNATRKPISRVRRATAWASVP